MYLTYSYSTNSTMQLHCKQWMYLCDQTDTSLYLKTHNTIISHTSSLLNYIKITGLSKSLFHDMYTHEYMFVLILHYRWQTTFYSNIQ